MSFTATLIFLRESRTKRPFLARQRLFFTRVSNETLISIAATLNFCESLERNVHFLHGNVDFLRESQTKRPFLARQRSFFTRVSSETLISMQQKPNFATVTQI